MKTNLNNLSKETLINIINNLQEEHYDLQSEYRYTFEQARSMQAEIAYLREQLGIASDMYAELREAQEAQRQKEFSMAQCIGELENDVDDLTQLYLNQLERTNEVGTELWLANKSNTLTDSDSKEYLLYYGDILDATTGEIVIEQQDLINLLSDNNENLYEDFREGGEFNEELMERIFPDNGEVPF